MSEEQNIQGETSQAATGNIETGNIPETTTMLDRADNIAKRVEEANKKSEELLRRHEEVISRMVLGGRASAGIPVKSAEQIEKEKLDSDVEATLKRYRA